MRQQMSQRQELRPEMSMLAMFPDDELQPRAGLQVFLDLKLDGGKLVPSVRICSPNDQPLVIDFLAVSARTFWSLGGNFRDFRRNAQIEFLQEDPTTPDIFVVLRYREWRWEHQTTSQLLALYVTALALDEEGLDPGHEEHGDPTDANAVLKNYPH